MPLLNGATDVRLGVKAVDRVCLGTEIVWERVPEPGAKPKIENVSQDGTLDVSWSFSISASRYDVLRNGKLVSVTNERSFKDSGLDWGKTYIYTIVPYYNSESPGIESPDSDPVTIPTGSCGDLSASNRTYTNVTISWAAVLGATRYEVYVNGVSQGQQAELSKSIPMSENQSKQFLVKVIRNDIIGGSSKTYTYYSGQREVRDSGSKTDMQFGPSRVDSWRTPDAWNYLSNIAAQGTYGTYGSYRGVIYYGPVGVRDSLRAQLGSTNRQIHGRCTRAHVYLDKRSGVGSSGTVTIGIQRTNSPASGGEPTGTGNVDRTSSAGGKGAWIEIGIEHGQAIGEGSYASLMLRKDGTGNYAQFLNGTLLLDWSWNYLLTSAKPNTWSVS